MTIQAQLPGSYIQQTPLGRSPYLPKIHTPQIRNYAGASTPQHNGRYCVLNPDAPHPHILALHTAPFDIAVLVLADIEALQRHTVRAGSVLIQLAAAQVALIRLITISDIRCIVVDSRLPIHTVVGAEGNAGAHRPWMGLRPSADRSDSMLLQILAALYHYDSIEAVAKACVTNRTNIYRRFTRYNVAPDLGQRFTPRQWADCVLAALSQPCIPEQGERFANN